jgi:hypothetical protein
VQLSDVLRIQKYWKYGNVDIKPVRRPGMGYLMKYLGKAIAIGIEAKVRRIGSSIIPAYLRRSWAKVQDAISFFLRFGETIDGFCNFEWNYKGLSFVLLLVSVFMLSAMLQVVGFVCMRLILFKRLFNGLSTF